MQWLAKSNRLHLIGLHWWSVYIKHEQRRHATTTKLHPFYSSLDFVWDYPGELVPEPIWIL